MVKKCDVDDPFALLPYCFWEHGSRRLVVWDCVWDCVEFLGEESGTRPSLMVSGTYGFSVSLVSVL